MLCILAGAPPQQTPPVSMPGSMPGPPGGAMGAPMRGPPPPRPPMGGVPPGGMYKINNHFSFLAYTKKINCVLVKEEVREFNII